MPQPRTKSRVARQRPDHSALLSGNSHQEQTESEETSEVAREADPAGNLARPGQYSRNELMRLQSVVGNQAVMRIISQQKQGLHTKPVSPSAQRTTAGVVQRAIGFEFEVPSSKTSMPSPKLTTAEKNGTAPWPGMNIKQDDTPRHGHTKKKPKTASPLNKQDVIIRGTNFELQADESSNGGTNMEFVMPAPVPETKEGRKSLDATMKEVTALAGFFKTHPGVPHEAQEVAGAGHGTAAMPRAAISTGQNIQGNPQTTAAIRIEQLGKFMQDIGAPTDGSDIGVEKLDLGYQRSNSKGDFKLVGQTPEDAKDAIKKFKKFMKETKEKLPKKFGSPALHSLVSLIITYLKKGESDNMDYPKLIAPLMGRTDFAKMFELLPEAQFFKDYPGYWKQINLIGAGMGGTGDVDVFTKGMRGKKFGPTRGYWLEQMTEGTDELTAAASGEAFYMSLGKLGDKTETVGQKKKKTQAPIFEMRRMNAEVPYTQWRGLTLDVFDYIYALNNMEKKAKYSRKNRTKIDKEG